MDAEARPNLENNAIGAVYEASLNGCVSTLNSLIHRDPLILSKVSLSPFSETPLHLAALLGHLEFCRVLLLRKPSLASEVDSQGRCPLHLASAEGHTEVVKELLLANPDICLAYDQDDKLPLHMAVIRGRMGVIKELIDAHPNSIGEVLDDDGSVLHLCLLYNRLEALTFLVETVIHVSGDQQLFTAKDKDHNTVLHLAAMLRRIKALKYLLSLPEIRRGANALNKMGLTALDVLEGRPRDFLSLRIQDILIEAGVKRSSDIGIGTAQPPSHEASDAGADQLKRSKWEYFYAKYFQYQCNWVAETRGTLMVVATVIATMTFQSAISPPGGVWQENTRTGGFNCTADTICEAGTAVLAYSWPCDFLNFMIFNTIAFFSSLCVVLLLVSGFPLKNRITMWILTIAMSITITFMGLTYMWAQGLVTPNHLLAKDFAMAYTLAGVWGVIQLAVGLMHSLRFFFWLKYKRRKKKKKKKKLHSLTHLSPRVISLNVNRKQMNYPHIILNQVV